MTPLTDQQGGDLIRAIEADSDAKKFPYCKLRVRWPDGSGETPWGRNLEGGMCSMENSPLYPKYRYRDILEVHGGEAGEVLYRHFPTKIVFMYEPLEEGEGDDPDLPRRKLLKEAIQGVQGAHMSFFMPGQAYVLCTREASPQAIAEALRATDLIVQGPSVETFDVDKDEYSYEDVTDSRQE